MSWIIENWKIILGVIVVLAILGSIIGKLEERKLLNKWNELIAEKKQIKVEIDAIRDKRYEESSEPERAKLSLEQYNLRLKRAKNWAEISKLRIEIIKKELDEEKRKEFINDRGHSDYCIKYAELEEAENRYKDDLSHVEKCEKDIQEEENENLFYQCKKCNEPYARERISNTWLNVEYLGSECELEDEDGIEQTIDDTSITKKEEQKGTNRWHKIKMHKIYQCKYCNDKTDEIQDNKVMGDFWRCPECAKDDVIKEIQTTELGQYKSYKEVVEENSRGKNTKQVSITKIREKTDYKCSNCGYEFSRVNSRELR